jgi:hypothetical protein
MNEWLMTFEESIYGWITPGSQGKAQDETQAPNTAQYGA